MLSDKDAIWKNANKYAILRYRKFEKFVRGSGSKSHSFSGALPSLVVIVSVTDQVRDKVNDKKPMFLNANGLQQKDN